MRMLLLRTNAGDQRARAIDSTQVKTADRGLRVHGFVIGYFWAEDSTIKLVSR